MTQAAASTIGRTYWAVGQRTPAESPYLTLRGSHYGAWVDLSHDDTRDGARVYSTKSRAWARLSALPKAYEDTGRLICWQIQQVRDCGGRVWEIVKDETPESYSWWDLDTMGGDEIRSCGTPQLLTLVGDAIAMHDAGDKRAAGCAARALEYLGMRVGIGA